MEESMTVVPSLVAPASVSLLEGSCRPFSFWTLLRVLFGIDSSLRVLCLCLYRWRELMEAQGRPRLICRWVWGEISNLDLRNSDRVMRMMRAQEAVVMGIIDGILSLQVPIWVLYVASTVQEVMSFAIGYCWWSPQPSPLLTSHRQSNSAEYEETSFE